MRENRPSPQLASKRPASYAVYALGCQQNWYDAERAAYFCDALGMLAATPKTAELIIIFSCSVRQKAMDRLYGLVGTWRKHSPKKTIVVTACVLPADKAVLNPLVDAIIPDQQIETWLKERYGDLPTPQAVPTALFGTNLTPIPHQAFVPITQGCNNFCTFCAVPHTRGREQSRPQDQIIKEVEAQLKLGNTSITLLGQNVNSYGLSDYAPRDLRKNKDANGHRWTPTHPSPFVELLRHLDQLPGLANLSFLSPNPQDFSDDLIDWMANSPVFTRTLNLPLQSGSDQVLKRMNRRYSQQEYLTLVDKIRAAVPTIVLSTDIIVGFPGETDADFAETLTVAKHAVFERAFIGIYSPRKGTTAEKVYPDDIPYPTKHQRYAALNDLINQQPTSLDARTAGRVHGKKNRKN